MARLARGFTLIEALIGLALAGVALGVLLPAIQKARAADARTKCADNMKQLGKAALEYESANGGLPFSAITKNNGQPPYIPFAAGTTAEPGKTGGTLGRCSGLVPLLPYVGKNDIVADYTFARDWSDPVNSKVLAVTFADFRCPADPNADKAVPNYKTTYITPGNDAFAPPNAPGSTTNILGAKVYPTKTATASGWAADYGAFTQIKTVKDATGAETEYANPLVVKAYPPKTVPGRGAMRQNATTKGTEITDGRSTTILYGEAAGRSRQCYADGKCDPFDADKQAGPIWADSDNRLTLTGTDPTGKKEFGKGPCVVNCNNQQGDLYSFHPNGAYVAFADGSVRFVKQTVAIDVLAALVTSNGGEKIDPTNY